MELETIGGRILNEAGESGVRKARRKEFNLKGAYLDKTELGENDTARGSNAILLKLEMWMDRERFEKLTHLAALNDKTLTHYINDAVAEHTEKELADTEKLGKLIARRIKAEAIDWGAPDYHLV